MHLKKVGVQWDGAYQLLLHDEIMEDHLPETWLLNAESFHWMWGRYPELVLKPTGRKEGGREIRLRRLDCQWAEWRMDMKTVRIPTEELLPRLQRLMHKSRAPYLLQQAIPRAEVRGQPFEVRVLTHCIEPKQAEWQVLGMIVVMEEEATERKKLKEDRFSLQTALEESNICSPDAQRLTDTTTRLAIRAAERLSPSFPRQRMLGFDFAVDFQGWVWLLDAFPKPSLVLFLEQLRKKDITQYREAAKKVRKHG